VEEPFGGAAEGTEVEGSSGKPVLSAKGTGASRHALSDTEREADVTLELLDEPQGGSSPFYQELTFLRRAQAALRKGDAAYALGLMGSLDQIQKGGALGSERSMTKVLALCQLGRAPEATVIARRLLRGNSHLPYVQRLRRSCADVSSMEETSASDLSSPGRDSSDE
jgi:hypothetical protein